MDSGVVGVLRFVFQCCLEGGETKSELRTRNIGKSQDPILPRCIICSVLTNLTTTILNDGLALPKKARGHSGHRKPSATLLESLIIHSSGPDREDDYAGSLMAGAIGGIVLGLLMIILVSLPLCCGVLKQYGKASGLESYIRLPDHEILEMTKSKHTEGER